MTQIVLAPKRVVVRVRCWPVRRKSGQVQTTVGLAGLQTARSRKVVAAERHNSVRI